MKNWSWEHPEVPVMGLLIRKEWLDLHLSGDKDWELRSRETKVRGRIALIEAGSGLIVGETRLIDCLEPLTPESAERSFHRHRVRDPEIIKKWCVPWVFEGTRAYEKPIPYKHPQGAVTWVLLTLKRLEEASYEQQARP